MTKSQEKNKSFFYYLNPYVWVKGIVSGIITFFLIINHFFILIMICVIGVLAILFSYDRYALSTYDESVESAYLVGSFSSHEVYKSPLNRTGRKLSHDLEVEYQRQAREALARKVEEEAVREANAVSNAPVAEPIWRRDEDVSRTFIQEEVRNRLSQIEQKVMRKRK